MIGSASGALAATPSEKPNIVIIFTDDQGWGDLGCYGSKTILTPRIDRLADQGMRFLDFYSQTVCGPARSALLTGRYPEYSRGWDMPGDEVTIGELLKSVGYTTGCIGKWDVSNRKDIKGRIPNDQGFDHFWGTLGANDPGRVKLYDNCKFIGEDRNLATLTQRYTDKGIQFIRENKNKPFFLYLCHTMPHTIIDASPDFKGRSKAGLYGDVIEEIDFHTGRIIDLLDELGLTEKTLVIFTSDNGPWCNYKGVLKRKHKGAVAWGSPGPFRGAKGSVYEGGPRVPCIVQWPKKVPAGITSRAIFATIDFLPTFARLAGYRIPDDRVIHGVDQTGLLFGKDPKGKRTTYFFSEVQRSNDRTGVRRGRWKLLLPGKQIKKHRFLKDFGSGQVELFDLEADIGEKKNLAEKYPEIVEELRGMIDSYYKGVKEYLEKRPELKRPLKKKKK